MNEYVIIFDKQDSLSYESKDTKSATRAALKNLKSPLILCVEGANT